MKRKRLTLVVIPNSRSSKAKEISLSNRLLWTALIVVVSLLSSLACYLWISGQKRENRESQKLTRLENERDVLLRRVREIRNDVQKLRKKMDELTKHDEMLRVIAEIPPINPDTRMVGIGGPFSPEQADASTLSADSKDVLNSLKGDIDRLIREAELEKDSFQRIQEKLERKHDLLDHTPSVVPATGYFTARWGMRRHPITGRMQFHQGVDIAGRTGDIVYASANGRVVYTGYSDYLGIAVVIDHGYGYQTIYGHLSRVTVQRGGQVKRGEKIGEIGSTGRSTGPHLHYSVKLNGKLVDPWSFFYSEQSFF